MGFSKKLKEECEDIFASSQANFNNKNPLAPRFAKILGHNNETTIGLVMKVDNERKSYTKKCIQVMTVVKMNL